MPSRLIHVVRSRFLCLSLLLLALLAGCGAPPTPSTPVPTPEPALPRGAVLLYLIRTPVGEAAWEVESVVLYPDGKVVYERVAPSGERQKGEQFVGTAGVARLVSLFEAAGFGTLDANYKQADPADRVQHLGLTMRSDERVYLVQWEPDTVPPALAEAVRELNQFLDVIRVSAS